MQQTLIQQIKGKLFQAVTALDLAERSASQNEKDFHLAKYADILISIIKKPMEQALQQQFAGNENNARAIGDLHVDCNNVVSHAEEILNS